MEYNTNINISNKIKEQNRKAVKKYSEKTMSFALKYYATDIQDGKRLESYLKTINMSTNQYLKELIKRDLDSKAVPYV